MINLLKINIICIGKVKEKYISDGINEFLKRLSKYVKVNIIELKEEADTNLELSILKESKNILEKISKNNVYNILLDLRGENITSINLASKIASLTLKYSEINFIIGGSNGVIDEVRNKVDYMWSFSKLTFPHQLIRLILLEQIYRSICINNNIKYHK